MPSVRNISNIFGLQHAIVAYLLQSVASDDYDHSIHNEVLYHLAPSIVRAQIYLGYPYIDSFRQYAFASMAQIVC